MKISASDVKKLRDMTGAGMMDAKNVLVEAEGDMDKALILMREKGLAKQAKKSDRITAEGLTRVAYADDHRSAAIVEVNTETDFVAENDDFKAFIDSCAVVALEEKPENLDQLKEKNAPGSDKSLADTLTDLIARIGENMSIRRFQVLQADKGYVLGYTHGKGNISVIVQLDTEAGYEDIEELGKDIAMQVASMNPKYIKTEDIDQDYIKSEKEILLQQALNENEEAEAQGKKGKPQNIIEKIVDGRLSKELKEVCLVDQAFIKDSSITISQLIDQTAKKVGSEIKLVDAIRYEVGEGLEKKEENFAEEVAKQMQG